MSDTLQKYFSPRLLDYIVIVGARQPEAARGSVSVPELLRRYPPEDHKDFPLPPDVIFFCQPEGCSSVGPRRMSLRETNSFVFALTEKDKNRVRYGICINFFLPFILRKSKSRPRRQSTSATGSEVGFIEDGQKEVGSISGRRLSSVSRTKTEKQNYASTLTSICIISHHPFFSTFRECLFTIKRLIESCSNRNTRSKKSEKKLKRDLVWTLLTTGLPENINIAQSVINDVKELEMFCLRLLNTPVPVPGKTRVELELLSVDLHAPLVFALPDHTRFSLVDFPLHLPLELLGVSTCLRVLACILLEQKIVLQSRDYNALSMSVMAFVTVIYPLEYVFPVIPLLPTCMKNAEQLLLAPTPYIIGVPASFLKYKRNFRLPNDVFLVDLDSNKIYRPKGVEELPLLPEPASSQLIQHLEHALHSMTMSPQDFRDSDHLQTPAAVGGQKKSPTSPMKAPKLIYGNDVDSVDVATRVAMIRFFNSPSLLSNFSEHTRTIKLYPRPVVAFQTNSFLQSKYKPSLFLSKFVRTQAVEYFAEWALNPVNVAFLRVQTGVCDPALIGDKAKWFMDQLEPIKVKVWSDAIVDIYANPTGLGEQSSSNAELTHSSSTDDSEDVSTSSSYSSLSDFMMEMTCRSEIPTDLPAALSDIRSSQLLCDAKAIYHPPEELQLRSVDSDSSTKVMKADTTAASMTSKGSEKQGSASSSPTRSASSSSNSDASLSDEEEKTFNPASLHTESDLVLDPLPVGHGLPNIIPARQSSENMDKSRSPTPQKSFDWRPVSAEPSIDKPSGLSVDGSPTISRTISISSVFSKNIPFGSTSSGSSSSSISFLDRFASETKELAREAKAAGKSAIEATKKEVEGRKGLIKNLQAIGEPYKETMKESARELWRSSQDENWTKDSDSASMISSGSDFNGFADKTSSVISGLFGARGASFLKEKPNFAPFPKVPGRKGLVERTSLIKHSSGNQQRRLDSSSSRLSADSKTSNSENQQFLKEVINSVLDGDGVGWLKLTRVKKLMEEESYRVLVVSKMNKTLEKKVSPDDHIDDVCVSKSVWKGMLKLLLAIFAGLEHSFVRQGASGGMASSLCALEIAHTHYWAKSVNEERGESTAASTASASRSNSPFGSHENLRKLSAVERTSPASEKPPEKPITEKEDELMELPKKLEAPMTRMMSTESDVSEANTEVTAPVSDPGSISAHAVASRATRSSQASCRSNYSDSEIDSIGGHSRDNRATSIWSSKSSVGTGFRYHGGILIGSASIPMEASRTYLFQGLIGKDRSPLFDQPEWWENFFLDAVAEERESMGLDEGPGEMIQRYRSLSQTADKEHRMRLEHEEDRLLTTLLYNLTSYMVMVNFDRNEIRRKVRRLLGKCHIGVVYSDEINGLLDQVEHLHGNDVDLKPLASRQMHRQTFTLHLGTDSSGEMVFMEVRDDGLILRSINGTIMERWWYERLINMTYSPKNKVLCLWRRNGGQTQLHKYYTKKCKELYYSIKEAMERAATRGTGALPGTELGGEFPVQDMKTGEGGLLQVCMEGVGLLFANSKDFEFFVRLENIRKCFTQKGGIFVLEEFNPKTRQLIQRRYRSQLADQICYSVLCVFSYIAAGLEQQKKKREQQSQQAQQQQQSPQAQQPSEATESESSSEATTIRASSQRQGQVSSAKSSPVK